MQTLHSRIRAAREAAGYSHSHIAKAIGISKQAVGQWEKEDGTIPNGPNLVDLARLLAVSPDWLALGHGKKERRVLAADPTIAEVEVRAGMGGGGESIIVNQPDGNGGTIAADQTRADWGIPEYYLTNEVGVRSNDARIIEVIGDSMVPTLFSGDRVMVNTGDRNPTPDGVFCLWDGFGVLVKRVQRIPNTDPPSLRISSDNESTQSFERTAEEVHIIGRVVCYLRRL